jgi:hypothetical protein
VQLQAERLDERVNPTNDLFATADVLSVPSFTMGSNVGYTSEPGEPVPAQASAWWDYTPSAAGTWSIDASGTGFMANLAVYTGDSVDALTLVGQSAAYPWGPTAPLKLDVSAGTTYHLAVDTLDGTTGTIQLNSTFAEPPSNDDYADAALVTGDQFALTGTLAGATVEPGEPAHGPFGPPAASVWFRYTAESDGAVRLSMPSDMYQPAVQVASYTGAAVESLTAQQQLFLYNGNAGYLNVQAGVTYDVAVAVPPYSYSDATPFHLVGEFLPPPNHDAFANAEILSGDAVTFAGTNAGATGEVGEPDHGAGKTVGGYPGFPGVSATALDPATGALGSVWYAWTAPEDGTIVLESTTSNFLTLVGVYTGADVDELTPMPTALAGNEIGPQRTRFDVTAGTTYHLAVDGQEGQIGDFAFKLGYAPANDDFTDAQVLDPGVVLHTVTGTLTNATSEPGEPGGSWLQSVWYRLTPTTSGTLFLQRPADDYSTTLAVYSGTDLGTLSQWSWSEPYSSDVFVMPVEAGTTYHLAALTYPYSDAGKFTFTVGFASSPGVQIIDDTLFVVGSAGNDRLDVLALGSAADGSTGLSAVLTTPTGKFSANTTTPVSKAIVLTGAGSDTVQLASTLTLTTTGVLGAGQDKWTSGDGADEVFGDTTDLFGWFGESDYLSTGGGADQVNAGAGNNVIDVGAGDNLVSAGFGNDVVRGGDGRNSIMAGDGDNQITLGHGDNGVVGGLGKDHVTVGHGTNSIFTAGGADWIITGNGNNSVSAGAGDDRVITGAGDDFVTDDGGHNRIDTGAGADVVNVNALEWHIDPIGWMPTVTKGKGSNVIRTGAGDDRVTVLNDEGTADVGLGAGADYAEVSDGTNRVNGHEGNDILIGGNGSDTLVGGLGLDLLVGGWGADTLIGGDGADLLFAGVLSAPPGIGWPLMLPPPPFGGSTLYSDLLLAWSSAPNTPEAEATVRALATPVVSDDNADDVVTGGFGSDWFWTTETTDTLDRKPDELLN